MIASLPSVPDELLFARNVAEEFVEIRACRLFADWTPPRVVRYEDRYYQLVSSSNGVAPRPFIYTLRRLAAGVPGRTVLTYAPERTPIRVKR